MSAAETACHAMHAGLLRTAALMVPTGQRGEWRREWDAELWHVCAASQTSAFSWTAQREIAGFCFGAFSDALCVRRQSRDAAEPSTHLHGSAAQYLIGLAAAALLTMLVASLLPGVRAENEASRFQVTQGLLLVQDSNRSARLNAPTISPALYLEWKATRQRYFDGLAYYRMERESASLPFPRRTWNVAHATMNFFDVLGVPLHRAAPADEAERGLPQVMVSHAAWVRDFHRDPATAGRVMQLGARWVRIAGVVPAAAWRVPGAPDAWLLEDDAQLAANTPGLGYLIARLSWLGQREDWRATEVPITPRGPDAGPLDLNGTAIAVPIAGPRILCQFALILALLALPAVTSVSLGESNFSCHRPPLKRRLLRALFLAAKMGMIATIGCYGSLVVSYSGTSDYSPAAECVQVMTCFLICLLGFRWALVDQRHRCPVCLRRVTHPAQVGLASRTFLGWNGTEMMCMGGHTLLHVPSLPTSWFSTQRWMYLDASWEFLFADSPVW